MIKAQSLIRESPFIWSRDPALTLPADPAEAERVLKVARDTGDYRALVQGDEQPTVFHVRHLTRSQFAWWIGEREHSSIYGRPLSGAESDDLLVRLALRRVENFGKHEVKFYKYQGHSLVTAEFIDAIHEEAGEAGVDLLGDLTRFVIERMSLRPL
jgi:hypothetical protein